MVAHKYMSPVRSSADVTIVQFLESGFALRLLLLIKKYKYENF